MVRKNQLDQEGKWRGLPVLMIIGLLSVALFGLLVFSLLGVSRQSEQSVNSLLPQRAALENIDFTGAIEEHNPSTVNLTIPRITDAQQYEVFRNRKLIAVGLIISIAGLVIGIAAMHNIMTKILADVDSNEYFEGLNFPFPAKADEYTTLLALLIITGLIFFFVMLTIANLFEKFNSKWKLLFSGSGILFVITLLLNAAGYAIPNDAWTKIGPFLVSSISGVIFVFSIYDNTDSKKNIGFFGMLASKAWLVIYGIFLLVMVSQLATKLGSKDL